MIPIEALRRVRRIIVHADCPDGIASAMILHDCLPDAEIIAVAYGAERDALEPGPRDLFCDMTPPEIKADAFVAAGAIVLDHHRGARELVERLGELGVYADAVAEPGVSGAGLAYREVWLPLYRGGREDVAARLDRLAVLAGVRDCWCREHPLWHDACAQGEVLMFRSREYWFAGRFPFLTEAEAELGAALWQRKLRRAREIAESGCLRLSPSVAIFNDAPKPDSRISDVAEAMREADPAVKLVAGFFYKLYGAELRLEFHLRSSPGAELTARQIAVANGGGGHDHAAGFTVKVGPWCLPEGGGYTELNNRSPIEIFKSALACAF